MPLTQAYNRITLIEIHASKNRARIITTFASNEQVKTGVDGEVEIFVWITEWQHFDPTSYVEISGLNASGDFVIRAWYFTTDGEWSSLPVKFATITRIEYKGYFMAFIRQDPPRSSAGEGHSRSQPRGLDFLPFAILGVAICGGISIVAFRNDKIKRSLYE